MAYLLAIDQGTTSTRAVLFDSRANAIAAHSVPLRQIYPANGWVEHDPEEIWQAVSACCREAAKGVAPKDIDAIGITNQRETTVLWERASGKPVHNAIVWQDRRTAARCDELKEEGREALVSERTGLLLDPYFSATKLEWLLANVPDANARAKEGLLAFGTVDSWLVYRLTGGRVHATDITNASRTVLFNIHSLRWDDGMLRLFGVPHEILPEIRQCATDFGTTEIVGSPIRITGVAGDQQAAMFGQACFATGDLKCTYGTGCFALVNTGAKATGSRNRLITTLAYQAAGEPSYAIEGSIFIAGAVIQWLRDALQVIKSSEDVNALAEMAKDMPRLYFVPAFTGLGAPYWDADARGAILGLTRDAGAAEIARAALDAVCYQTRDLLEAMTADLKYAGLTAPNTMRVDGGMVRSDGFCQRLADLTGLVIERPQFTETTALGAALLAGLGAGIFKSENEIAKLWSLGRRFEPALSAARRDTLFDGWRHAVARVRSH
ncbi:MAG: glycerol kinase GlpK [Alphaproteobacteria bacterium]